MATVCTCRVPDDRPAGTKTTTLHPRRRGRAGIDTHRSWQVRVRCAWARSGVLGRPHTTSAPSGYLRGTWARPGGTWSRAGSPLRVALATRCTRRRRWPWRSSRRWRLQTCRCRRHGLTRSGSRRRCQWRGRSSDSWSWSRRLPPRTHCPCAQPPSTGSSSDAMRPASRTCRRRRCLQMDVFRLCLSNRLPQVMLK